MMDSSMAAASFDIEIQKMNQNRFVDHHKTSNSNSSRGKSSGSGNGNSGSITSICSYLITWSSPYSVAQKQPTSVSPLLTLPVWGVESIADTKHWHPQCLPSPGLRTWLLPPLLPPHPEDPPTSSCAATDSHHRQTTAPSEGWSNSWVDVGTGRSVHSRPYLLFDLLEEIEY